VEQARHDGKAVETEADWVTRSRASTTRNVAKFLSALYRIPPEQIATIGDMPNDVLMFAHSGLSSRWARAVAKCIARHGV
jgi:hydroxymethylpyrimidine pyrophosphatase-like HAD family hydrolase